MYDTAPDIDGVVAASVPVYVYVALRTNEATPFNKLLVLLVLL